MKRVVQRLRFISDLPVKPCNNFKRQFLGPLVLGDQTLAVDAVLDRGLAARGAEVVEEPREKPADPVDIADGFDLVFKYPGLPFFGEQFAVGTVMASQSIRADFADQDGTVGL